MKRLSLCMIVKNEEKHLFRCLKSVKTLFDEIIIVDTGSTDNTKEVAKKYTDKIYDFEWIDDFSAARNFAFSKATADYVMWLDADDVIETVDLEKLIKLKKALDGSVDVYMLKYNISFDYKGNPTFSYYRERILKRENNFKWVDPVHEYISISGNIKREDVAITHKKEATGLNKRNLKIYQEMEKAGQEFSPRNLYYYGRELNDHGKVKKAIKILKEFLNTNKGWKEDIINAWIIIYGCYINLGRDDEAIKSLYQTFNYDIPRPKVCTTIGYYFLTKEKYHQAIYWFLQAINNKGSDLEGFYEKEYSEFYPLLNLVVCYDKIGDIDMALKYHETTKKINPHNSAVINNDEYFRKLKNK